MQSDVQSQSKPPILQGNRFVLTVNDHYYPHSFALVENPPDCIYGVGNPEALQEGIAIVGARKATPYGISCAKRFARIAAEVGITVVSGGAYGCDSASHEACLDMNGRTIAILGGGCDQLYPRRHAALFQRIVDTGGAVISEYDWNVPPLPHGFVQRNRLIAGLARAVLIVEAGMPSGTFSTADAALRYGKEVLVVPGAITSPNSSGCNALLYQGAIPIIDDDSFRDVLFTTYGILKHPPSDNPNEPLYGSANEEQLFNPLFLPVFQALKASPYRVEQIMDMAQEGRFENLSFAILVEGLTVGIEHGLLVQNDGGAYSYRVRE